MSSSTSSWICCQLGAREHYAVPRALQMSGVLGEFITDLWIRPGTLLHSWRKSLNGRFHPALEDAQVKAPNVAALTFELKASATGVDGWKLISRRNDWFQRQALAQLAQSHKESPNGNHTVFAYSYAAERILEFAREQGWRTVLGQIDPGPAEERIVAGLHEKSSPPQNGWEPAPSQYWERWRTECALADEIIVNSLWSKKALLTEGITQEKIRIVPVAYEAAPESGSFQRHYPETFTFERPLRVLFLGQINLRKGVGQLFEAIKLLTGESIEFWFVGPGQVSIPPELKKHPVKWFGVVSRLEVSNFYKQADLFILPTLSDGFGLTQLEALSWKLPVVATSYCGEVVQDGLNGLILEEVSGRAIAGVLLRFLQSPEMLVTMSANSVVSDRFSLKTLASSLTGLQ